ncbi:hypothetical protein NQ317_006765 [Molorchus minor]|uniref:Major facilitator superfamily (MFS) profile domain-containing protein n=1 Tax=Molorchus minor TaxID=1323400 RepID=A0ABQ9JNI4_9CUCU|nr:hypothetical protein NQ317_006765 [Molorchus minor]
MEGNHLPMLKNNEDKVVPVVKAVKRRWLILIIYIIYAAISTLQWVQYSIITNIVMRYYNVSASAVDWTAMVFMIMWPILVFPASFIIDKMGLRVAALIGCGTTALGAGIKVFSIGQGLFYVVLIGQTVAAVSQIFILSLPPKIAVTWFKANEVSKVCSLGIFGMQLGTALGFVLPPMIVKNHSNVEDIGLDLHMLCWGITAVIVPVAFVVFFYFPEKPKYPPSRAQLEETEHQEVTFSVFIDSLKTLIKNKPFLVHTASYGFCYGIFSAFSTLLNQFVLNYFEGAEEDAGRMGLAMVIIGIAGSILTGFVLDKTHKYKETSFTIFLLCAVGIAGLLFSFEIKQKWLVYVTISIFGFFLNAYIPAGVEFATELTFPSPESTVTGILLATSQILAVVFTLVLSVINKRLGTFWALSIQCIILLIGTVLTALTPNRLRRQDAFRRDVQFDKIPSKVIFQEEISPIVKAYKIRWVILVIYVVFAAISTFQWVQHSVISEILVKYYDVSATLTEWGVTVPPFIVHNHTKTDDIGADLVALRNSIAGAILPVAFILFLYYPKRPDHAPSHVQLEERQNGEPVTIGVYLEFLKVLFTNKSFLLQMLIYGIGIGISFALGTCLNQIVRNNFEDSKDSDKIIIVMIVAGMVGCICMGLILDRTHKYKFLLNGYMPAGIEFAIELTFPSPESAVIGVLLTVSHLFGIVISIALREINTEFGTLWTVFSLVVVLLIETLLTYLIPNRLRRQDAFENIHSEEGSLFPIVSLYLDLEHVSTKFSTKNWKDMDKNMSPAESNGLIEKIPHVSIKAYRRRWLILLIFILYSAANSFQWMEYSIITNIVKRYYNVSSLAVDWTSIIYMAIYPIIVIPVSYIIDKKGLRVAALIGGLGTALAAGIKVFSVNSNLFYVVLIGQAVGSTAQVFVLCLPAKIAAVWFKSSEASTACSLAFFGTQLGFALGFICPTSIVKNHEVVAFIGSNLRQLCTGLAIYMIPVSVAIIFFFPAQPPLPPSLTQVEERKREPPSFQEFFTMFKKLLKKNGFILHMTAYGINIGVFAAFSTFINQFVLQYFEDSEEDAGRMGLLQICAGMVGSILFGFFLDKTHRYKETTLFLCYMSAVGVASFAISLELKNKILAYITVGLAGFFTNAYMPVGFEFAVEITFPSDESTTTGLLNAMNQALGVFITLAVGELNNRLGPLWALSILSSLLFFGALLTQMVPNQKRRQEALRKIRVSSLLVDWTSIIYMALYPIFVIPASYIIDKKGLRTAGLIGCIGTLLGTALKVLSIRNDLFYIVLIGQAIVSASQVVIICLPPKIAAVWFKPSEVSTACSLGVLGSQLGVALGYLLPPVLVQDSKNLEEIGNGFKSLCWLLTGSIIPVTLMVLSYFPNEPPLPPSKAQASLRDNKGANEDAGRMGFLSVFTGMVGMLLFGVILDKTHKYKTFIYGYMPVGFELAMELTFPLEESTTTGILLAMTQLLGTPFAVCAGLLNKAIGSFWTLGILAGLLFIGTVITGCVPNNLLRQEAFRTGNSELKRKASQYGSRLGLRIAGLIGCIGTLLGTGIKVFSVRNDLFSIVLIGQAIVSASQVVIVCLPPKIAAVWFKPSEISTACSIGVLGSQIGVALGYLLPPMLVHDSTNLEEIGEGFKLLCWLLTGLMIPVTLMVTSPNEPPLPPSNAQASIRDKKVEFKTKSFFTSLKKLFLNKGFVIHMIGYGINIGVLSAAGTLLNQFILQYFKGANEDAGRMGFVNVFTGMVGMLIFGLVELLVGFELAMELTFPLEESTTTGILLAMTQLLGTPFAVCAGLLNKEVGSFWTLGILAGFLFIGTVVTGCVPNKLLRQEAFRTGDSIMKRKASQYGSRLVYIP